MEPRNGLRTGAHNKALRKQSALQHEAQVVSNKLQYRTARARWADQHQLVDTVGVTGLHRPQHTMPHDKGVDEATKRFANPPRTQQQVNLPWNGQQA
jgi:hypothetical protein